MGLEQTRLYFSARGTLSGLERSDHGYGVYVGKTQNGSAYKKAKFDIIASTDANKKYTVEIFGCEREYANGKIKKTGEFVNVPWNERLSREDIRFFPIPYDAATEIECAEDGGKYFVSGEVDVNPYTDKEGINRFFTHLNADNVVSVEDEKEPMTNLSGKFVFAGVDKKDKVIKGFLINYKEDVSPIDFVWGGSDDVLNRIDDFIKFGTLCKVTKGYLDKEEVVSKSGSPRTDGSKGTQFGAADASFSNFKTYKTQFVLEGIQTLDDGVEPYTREDLGLDE